MLPDVHMQISAVTQLVLVNLVRLYSLVCIQVSAKLLCVESLTAVLMTRTEAHH